MTSASPANLRSPLGAHWGLDPNVTFLNHGSFGACPTEVRRHRAGLLDRMERQPVDFMVRELPELHFSVVRRLEDFLGAERGSLVLLPNATAGVATALQAVDLRPGQQVLTTGQEYFATRNAVFRRAEECGAEVVEVAAPFPVDGADELLEPLLDGVCPSTGLIVVDHIFSPSGVVFPLAGLVRKLGSNRPPILVDGAHGPGQMELELKSLGVEFYTGNCHKWLCSPKSCAVLYTRPDYQDRVRPLAQSYTPRDMDADLSRYQLEHFWNGTFDPTPRLSVPTAIDVMAALVPGGWPEVIRRNHALALRARNTICGSIGVAPPCPEEMVGAMAAIPLPWKEPPHPRKPEWTDPLQHRLRSVGIEVPVTWSRLPRMRMLRISAQLYNAHEEYQMLADALGAMSAGS